MKRYDMVLYKMIPGQIPSATFGIIKYDINIKAAYLNLETIRSEIIKNIFQILSSDLL